MLSSIHFLLKYFLSNSGYICFNICSISDTFNCVLNPELSKKTPRFNLSEGVSFSAGIPKVFTVPLSGFISPVINPIAVLLPAPFLPTSPVITPCGIFINGISKL